MADRQSATAMRHCACPNVAVTISRTSPVALLKVHRSNGLVVSAVQRVSQGAEVRGIHCLKTALSGGGNDVSGPGDVARIPSHNSSLARSLAAIFGEDVVHARRGLDELLNIVNSRLVGTIHSL
eukprot:CAMPEP_0115862484 /NCGR_PEP_ID=MMETSP0287-20121206/18197_1 /TAXON_ID=412157 /ORGANISM="Chrysochromulina rotalis, Strain UIO044" /LENGTH=123 /DNA_ID=CAMNT_0003316901 /DNA_START=143 /DNA_END=515 /DNA_ORIENTATION=-